MLSPRRTPASHAFHPTLQRHSLMSPRHQNPRPLTTHQFRYPKLQTAKSRKSDSKTTTINTRASSSSYEPLAPRIRRRYQTQFPGRYGTFRKEGVPDFGVLIIRILLFRVLYWGPLFSKTPIFRRAYDFTLPSLGRHVHDTDLGSSLN